MIKRSDIAAAMNAYGTDKVAIHGYDQMYSVVFGDAGYTSEVHPGSLLEIGVRRGRSLLGWKQLLPDTKVVGLEKVLAADMLDGVAAMTIEGNSTRQTTQELLDPSYDIIIDDGDHRPNMQWATFLNMENRWTKAYVIEDVIGHDNEKLLRKRLKSKGYVNIKTFGSKLSNGVVRAQGVDQQFQFFGMVVYPK